MTTSTTIRLQHFIAGRWVAGDVVTEGRNPAHEDEIVALVPVGDGAVARSALESARAALPGWARTPAPARGEVLHRAAALVDERADAIARELTREEGKTLTEATGEVRRAAAILRYFAGRTSDPIGEVYASASHGTRIATLRQPVGVVAVITPWNFPIAIPAWKLAPALAYGNTVVFKPAGATPLTALRLVEALVDAGLPDGTLNLVLAPGPAVTDAWLVEGGVDAVSFTGSAPVGRALHSVAGRAHARVQLELGGKNAVVVAPDADLDRAADLIARGAFASAGQKCTATSRVITFGSVAAPLRDRLIDRMAALRPGDPLDAATSLPPLIDRDAQERVASMVASAVTTGARLAYRGDAPQHSGFHPAVLLDSVEPSMSIARDEVFGPVVALLESKDLDDAIRIHNSVSYGLSGAIFTRDLATADTFVHAARVGVLHVNGETAGAEPHVPFGGMKDSSSWSREQGREAEAFYTQTKTVYWDGMPGASLFDQG